jgi:hypothetical protein
MKTAIYAPPEKGLPYIVLTIEDEKDNGMTETALVSNRAEARKLALSRSGSPAETRESRRPPSSAV